MTQANISFDPWGIFFQHAEWGEEHGRVFKSIVLICTEIIGFNGLVDTR